MSEWVRKRSSGQLEGRVTVRDERGGRLLICAEHELMVGRSLICAEHELMVGRLLIYMVGNSLFRKKHIYV